MERVKAFVFGKPEPVKKRLIRDTKGRPVYLSKLSFMRRHPTAFALGGGILSTLICFSGSIYHLIFT